MVAEPTGQAAIVQGHEGRPYVTNAKGVVADQLSKAGARLAFVLNEALE
jgi:hypothetical protein